MSELELASALHIDAVNANSLPGSATSGCTAAQVDPKKIETHIYVYGGELADPGPRLRQAVLNVTPRPKAMWSLN